MNKSIKRAVKLDAAIFLTLLHTSICAHCLYTFHWCLTTLFYSIYQKAVAHAIFSNMFALKHVKARFDSLFFSRSQLDEKHEINFFFLVSFLLKHEYKAYLAVDSYI